MSDLGIKLVLTNEKKIIFHEVFSSWYLYFFLWRAHAVAVRINLPHPYLPCEILTVFQTIKPCRKIESAADLAQGGDPNILEIRSEYQRINNLSTKASQHVVTCDVKDTINYFTDNGEVVKVAINFGFIGDGISSHEYYYRNGKLIFVFKVSYSYGPASGESKFEERYYVKNDSTIRYIRNLEITGCNSCSFSPKSREYLALEAFKSGDYAAAVCMQ